MMNDVNYPVTSLVNLYLVTATRKISHGKSIAMLRRFAREDNVPIIILKGYVERIVHVP